MRESGQKVIVHPLMPKRELLEIHRSKISLHCAKLDYNYPAIRLPHTFSTLVGLPTRICQTVHAQLTFDLVLAAFAVCHVPITRSGALRS